MKKDKNPPSEEEIQKAYNQEIEDTEREAFFGRYGYCPMEREEEKNES